MAIYVVLDIVVQLLPPHYSPISQAESDLGVGPYGWLMDLNFVVRGILSLALVYALYRLWPGASPRPRIGLALVGTWGAAAFVLAVSPADVSGPATVHGTVHDIAAFAAFLCVAIGALGISRSMPLDSPWRSVRTYARPLATLTAIALVLLALGTGIHRVETQYFGLLERIFIGSALLWMLVVSVGMLRGELRAVGPAGTRVGFSGSS